MIAGSLGFGIGLAGGTGFGAGTGSGGGVGDGVGVGTFGLLARFKKAIKSLKLPELRLILECWGSARTVCILDAELPSPFPIE